MEGFDMRWDRARKELLCSICADLVRKKDLTICKQK